MKKTTLTQNSKQPAVHPTKYRKPRFIQDFLLCGALGLFTEFLFTSADSLKKRDLSLRGTTSLWMFPIYGLSALIAPVSSFLRQKKTPAWIRGSIYTLCIFSAEYLSGQKLRSKKCCPWDYHRSRFHIRGLIRLDYAPWWFLFSLAIEKLLTFAHLRAQKAEK